MADVWRMDWRGQEFTHGRLVGRLFQSSGSRQWPGLVEMVKNWLDSGCILEGKQPNRLADGFIVRYERKRSIKHSNQVFDLITCLESIALYYCRKDFGEEQICGRMSVFSFHHAEF